ncbi:ZIP family metal transporter [Skeletonema marinoi]|uniref:ZIP family metal transporter n=1 Tax=Skeletonema marinoi TaxID=267567 RepID=A0AAD8Y0J8_9STRA|nr:ZIP family metal transporter [Skeletonema marinoi]
MKGSIDADAGWMPLLLSTIAGMSTCLGALIVFCHPVEDDEEHNNSESDKLIAGNNSNNKNRFRMKGRRKVSPSTMSFSLALAGSVMITVSVVSIGPECLAASSMPQNEHMEDEENTFFIFGLTLMPIFSMAFLHRLISFGVGCLIYFLMSKCCFPEPEEILEQNSDLFSTPARSSISSVKSSDSETDEDIELSMQNSKNNTTLMLSPGADEVMNLQRRSGAANKETSTTLDVTNSPSTKKGIFRRSPVDRIKCCTWVRALTTGSDLATSEARRANRVAMLLFFSLLLHNFPEGLAVAASALESDQLGLTVTVGIMIHNIPEGIAIAIPCLKARPDSPMLSFVLASVSGLAEPAGAFISLVFLRGVEKRSGGAGEDRPVGGEGSLENVLAFVAGIMITVSFLELLPEAKRHSEKSGKTAYYAGLIVGCVVMVATELGMSL